MAYQSSIPLAGDLISVSQTDILNNFQAIGSAFPVNHVDFNQSGVGKHKFVEFPNQSTDPAGALAEMTLFSKVTAGLSQIFYKRDASVTSIQLTGIDPVASTNGYVWLPGGIIVQWGFSASPTDDAQINFPLTFPHATFSCIISPVKSGAVTNLRGPTLKQAPTTSGFTPRFSGTSLDGITFFAIGN